MNDWKSGYLKGKKANDVMFAWCETAKKQLVDLGKTIIKRDSTIIQQSSTIDFQVATLIYKDEIFRIKDAKIINQQSVIDTKDEIIGRMKELANMSHEASKREIFALKCLSACLLTAIIVMVIY